MKHASRHVLPDRPLFPERIEGAGGLLLRRWVVGDAEALGQAIAESIEHIRPWMAWIAHEPISTERRRAWIGEIRRNWTNGGDLILGIFLGGQIAGSCGLHRRLEPDGLEIGYWIHPAFARRGLATGAVSLLTSAALSLPDINYVEIQHDKANVASGGVPRKLGFKLVAEDPHEPEAPGHVGIVCRWRMDRETRRARR